MSKKEEFEEYKLVHNFLYPDSPLDPLVTEKNFTDIFKSQWSMLMEVIEKIENLKIDNQRVYVTIYTGYSVITSSLKMLSISSAHAPNKIARTHIAIVEFIKDYNKL